ncbi:MAG: Polyamine aminopropyltransferase [Dehalococcoidia bacterium]|nr:Polyamine aminopropyltransferase [Dehalococcoidia bacterium]
MAGKWFHDAVSRDLVQSHRVKTVLYSGRSKFQSVDIIETPGLGRCLVLDGKIQSSEKDEFIYHEALVHPVMVSHPEPKTVFIAGGGEGATLREVLRHRTVARAVMVDIDDEVVALSREWLPSWHQGAFEDKRAEVLHQDARKYLADGKERFDVLIFDLPDPVEEGPACLLYTQEFYRLAKERLNPGGLLVVQSGPASWLDFRVFVAINKTLATVFPLLCPYHVFVPSFGTAWGFTIASSHIDPAFLSARDVEERLEARVGEGLRYYDGFTHEGLFLLPKHLRSRLAQGKRVITDEKPLVAVASKDPLASWPMGKPSGR